MFRLALCLVVLSCVTRGYSHTPAEIEVADRYVEYHAVQTAYSAVGGRAEKAHGFEIDCPFVLANPDLLTHMSPYERNWLRLLAATNALEEAVRRTWTEQIQNVMPSLGPETSQEKRKKIENELLNFAIFSSIFSDEREIVTGSNQFARAGFDPRSYALEEWPWRFPFRPGGMEEYLKLVEEGLQNPGFLPDLGAVPGNLTKTQIPLWNARITDIRNAYAVFVPPKGFHARIEDLPLRNGGPGVWRPLYVFRGSTRTRLFPDLDPKVSKCCAQGNEYFCQGCPKGVAQYMFAERRRSQQH